MNDPHIEYRNVEIRHHMVTPDPVFWQFTVPPLTGTLTKPPRPKPPWPKWFIDLHLKAVKFASIEVIRAVIREAIRAAINSLSLGRKRQPAQVSPPA